MKPNRNRIRVWDKVHRKWLNPMLMGFDETGLIHLSGMGGPDNLAHDEVIICRSTGCCDRDGKEIFEGDIVTTIIYDSSSPTGEWRSIVKWDENNLEWALDTNLDGELCRFVDISNSPAMHPCTIIGNIYENPRKAKNYELG